MNTRLLEHLTEQDLAELVREANKGHGSNGVSGADAVRRFALLVADHLAPAAREEHMTTETQQPAVGAQVDLPVRPRAWWVAPEDSPSDGAVWVCEPTAEDLAWLKQQTGRAAVVTELGDVAAERERCATLVEGNHILSGGNGPNFCFGWESALKACANAIRGA